MFVDKTLQFSDAQALTSTGVSTNVVDLGADQDIGPGEPMYLVIAVGVSADATTGDETYEAQLQSGSTDTPTDVITKLQIPRTAKKGDILFTTVPAQNERYLRLNYVLGGTSPSITVDAFLTHLDPARWVATADAI